MVSSSRSSGGGERDGPSERGMVSKTLDPENPHLRRLAAAMVGPDALAAAQRYLADLSGVVALPDDVTFTMSGPRLAVRHRWVEGQSLRACLQRTPVLGIEAIQVVLGWCEEVNTTSRDARMDLNLENFVCTPDGPVLIDLLPPLIPSRAYAPESIGETILVSLCFDDLLAAAAMCGYALNALLRKGLGTEATRLADIIESRGIAIAAPETQTPDRLLMARSEVLCRVAKGGLSYERAGPFIAASAVTPILAATPLDASALVNSAWALYHQLER